MFIIRERLYAYPVVQWASVEQTFSFGVTHLLQKLKVLWNGVKKTHRFSILYLSRKMSIQMCVLEHTQCVNVGQ